MATGRMHSFLRGLDEWLLREDPDVCAQAAQEVAYAEAMEALGISDGEESDAQYDATQDERRHQRPDRHAGLRGPTDA